MQHIRVLIGTLCVCYIYLSYFGLVQKKQITQRRNVRIKRTALIYSEIYNIGSYYVISCNLVLVGGHSLDNFSNMAIKNTLQVESSLLCKAEICHIIHACMNLISYAASLLPMCLLFIFKDRIGQ